MVESVPDLTGMAQKDSSLASAIPLDSPVTKALSAFSVQCATSQAAAVIAVAITPDGQVMLTGIGGSAVMKLGMLQAAMQMLAVKGEQG